jgi:nicotinate-nucleotide adenylyltransferase
VGGTSGERLGVFGGTFDPVHVAHLVAAVNARHVLGLDRVLLVVANRPWQKSSRAVTPPEDRYAMVEAAVAGQPGVEASRLELDRGGDSYSADTLRALADEDPSRELFLVVGADVAAELDTWRHVDVTRELATLAVVSRPGAPEVDPGPGWRVVRVDIPHLAVSASDLRRRVAAGLPLDYLVPAPAIDLIRARGLYAGGR